MPTLRPLTELTRSDGRFFVDAIVPALRAAGFAEPVALRLREPELAFGDVHTAVLVVEGTQAELEHLLTGKQKMELSAKDKLARQADVSTLVVRAPASALRALVRAVRPAAGKQKTPAREVATEASARPLPRAPRKRDRVRTVDGRYIKGSRPGAPAGPSAPSSMTTVAPPPGRVVGEARSGATDRVSFALQNLAAWVEGGLARATDAGDAEMLTLVPGDVRREVGDG